ncbi:YbiU family protein, partial [Escherichia sp. TW10509]
MTFTYETLPTDAKTAIRKMKAELRQQIGDLQQVFDKLSAKIEARVAEIDALKGQGLPVWPEVPYSDVAAGTVSETTRNEIKRRGCAVIKGHFPREQALAWDRAMLDYLDANHFDDVYKGPGDSFFGSLEASRPEIYPIYWSQAQMQARQSDNMAAVQS